MSSRDRAERLWPVPIPRFFTKLLQRASTDYREEESDSKDLNGGGKGVQGSRKMKLGAPILGILSFAMLTGVNATSTGKIGQSQVGATCHSSTPDSGVSVMVSGIPSTYQPGTSYPLTTYVSGSPGTGGGFDLSVTRGTLSTTDPRVQVVNGEATHTNPNARSWSVNWLAPPAGSGTATFHAAVLAANVDGSSAGDAWNTDSYSSSEYTGGGGGPTGTGTTGTDWFPIAFAAVVILAVVMVVVLALRGRSQAKKEQKGRRKKKAQRKWILIYATAAIAPFDC